MEMLEGMKSKAISSNTSKRIVTTNIINDTSSSSKPSSPSLVLRQTKQQQEKIKFKLVSLDELLANCAPSFGMKIHSGASIS